jgi:hypothetical protein
MEDNYPGVHQVPQTENLKMRLRSEILLTIYARKIMQTTKSLQTKHGSIYILFKHNHLA